MYFVIFLKNAISIVVLVVYLNPYQYLITDISRNEKLLNPLLLNYLLIIKSNNLMITLLFFNHLKKEGSFIYIPSPIVLSKLDYFFYVSTI